MHATTRMHVACFACSATRDSVMWRPVRRLRVACVSCESSYAVRCAWLHAKPGMRRPARRLRVACLWPASCFAFSAVRSSVVCDEAACEDEHGALYRK